MDTSILCVVAFVCIGHSVPEKFDVCDLTELLEDDLYVLRERDLFEASEAIALEPLRLGMRATRSGCDLHHFCIGLSLLSVDKVFASACDAAIEKK